MNADLFFWLLARVAGLSSFVALAVSLLSGMALRSGILGRFASNRAMRSLHEYTTVLWMPLGLLHLFSLLLDRTARVQIKDLVVPFAVPYGTLAVGLGTVSFELMLLVAVTGWLRRWLWPKAWLWVHRLSYLAFALVFIHALLAGTDFSDPVVSALTWSVTAMLAVLAAARLLWGRLPA